MKSVNGVDVDVSDISLMQEVKRRQIDILAYVEDWQLTDEMDHRDLNVRARDLDTNSLIEEIESRGFVVEPDYEYNPVAASIVQKHRCGQVWETDALEFLYNMSGKIV